MKVLKFILPAFLAVVLVACSSENTESDEMNEATMEMNEGGEHSDDATCDHSEKKACCSDEKKEACEKDGKKCESKCSDEEKAACKKDGKKCASEKESTTEEK